VAGGPRFFFVTKVVFAINYGNMKASRGEVATSAPVLFELEAVRRDLRRAARLAEHQVHRAISNLSFVDGKYIEAPDSEEAELAVFAVEAVAKLAEALERLYDTCPPVHARWCGPVTAMRQAEPSL
jgi:hypothetical protein